MLKILNNKIDKGLQFQLRNSWRNKLSKVLNVEVIYSTQRLMEYMTRLSEKLCLQSFELRYLRMYDIYMLYR